MPAIASNSPDEKIPTDDVLTGFLKINGDLRRKNNQYLTDLSKKSAPELFFKDAFQQLGNSQVEAKFADTRTYTYKGKDVDKQVHLGFDLAKTANVSIVASQRGRVVHASDLGIYGNCVVIDHGMGVQSLYGHLSSIGVKVGDKVEKGQELGRSGMTGLAGGDHLHFTMLVGGQQVTPVDWWSAQWMQDRVLRKITAAGGVSIIEDSGVIRCIPWFAYSRAPRSALAAVQRRLRRRWHGDGTTAPAPPARRSPIRSIRPRSSAITGTITLQGTPPPNPSINMGSDPYCMKLGAATTPDVRRLDDGGLENVFVYVKDGLGNAEVPGAVQRRSCSTRRAAVHAARVRHSGRPVARHREQRRDAAQHSRAADGQPRVQSRAGAAGDEIHDDLHRRRKSWCRSSATCTSG